MKTVAEEPVTSEGKGRRALTWTAAFTVLLSSLTAVFVWFRRLRRGSDSEE